MSGPRPDHVPRPRRNAVRRPARRARIVATGVSAVVAAGGVVAMADAALTNAGDTGEAIGVVAGVMGEHTEPALVVRESASALIPRPVPLPPEVGPGVS